MDVIKPFISISCDFGPGNKGVGVMIATALRICPNASVVPLHTDIRGFDLREGARVMEAVVYVPVGYHVCVVDPGVGTERRGIIVKVGRGDYLIGPDNGVLMTAARFLGGIKKVVQITNEKYMLKPVSPIFHGRDIFTPAAAHLANGVAMEEFGSELKVEDLVKAPYDEAKFNGKKIKAEIIYIHEKFGNVFLNIMHEEMHKLARGSDVISLKMKKGTIRVPYAKTFGNVKRGNAIIMDDDFGRVEIALNQGNFAKKYKCEVGDGIMLEK